MRKLLLIAFLALMCLCLGLFLSCGGGGGGGGGDDDNDDADDDDAADDDAVDDDADDDSASGDVWTDPAGLMWQVAPGGYMSWPDAGAYCAGLSLAGYDDWRLPTLSELRSLIKGCEFTVTGGSCYATDECLVSNCRDNSCDGCASGGGPADGCYGPSQLAGCDFYWSSSTVVDVAFTAWAIGFEEADITFNDEETGYWGARCVRDAE